MALLEDVSNWLAQAEADLRAARAEHADVAECHRRYWIQQSYEKAIKAYAIIRWRGHPTDEQFRKEFLRRHSPLKGVEPGKASLSKNLHVLARDVGTFVRGLDNAELLLKIDDTETSADPAKVSYRYPFYGSDARLAAPCVYDGWDGLLGNREGATAAVDRLIRAVRNELKVAARRPR
jgi:HEPN domain-containing protein